MRPPGGGRDLALQDHRRSLLDVEIQRRFLLSGRFGFRDRYLPRPPHQHGPDCLHEASRRIHDHSADCACGIGNPLRDLTGPGGDGGEEIRGQFGHGGAGAGQRGEVDRVFADFQLQLRQIDLDIHPADIERDEIALLEDGIGLRGFQRLQPRGNAVQVAGDVAQQILVAGSWHNQRVPARQRQLGWHHSHGARRLQRPQQRSHQPGLGVVQLLQVIGFLPGLRIDRGDFDRLGRAQQRCEVIGNVGAGARRVIGQHPVTRGQDRLQVVERPAQTRTVEVFQQPADRRCFGPDGVEPIEQRAAQAQAWRDGLAAHCFADQSKKLIGMA